MLLKVTFDDRKMRRFVRAIPKASDRAISRSLNKTITKVRTQAARAVAAKRNLKVGTARNEMALRKGSPDKPQAMIIAKGSPISLMDVQGAKRQTKKGVTVKIEKGKKPHLFAGAFIAKTKSGHVGVFRREDRLTKVSESGSPGTKRKNLPIVQINLPSVAATMIQEGINKKLEAFAAPVYERELVRLLELEMKRAGAR